MIVLENKEECIIQNINKVNFKDLIDASDEYIFSSTLNVIFTNDRSISDLFTLRAIIDKTLLSEINIYQEYWLCLLNRSKFFMRDIILTDYSNNKKICVFDMSNKLLLERNDEAGILSIYTYRELSSIKNIKYVPSTIHTIDFKDSSNNHVDSVINKMREKLTINILQSEERDKYTDDI